MPCPNPACPLSWANEVDKATGLIRVAEIPGYEPAGPWELASPVLLRYD